MATLEVTTRLFMCVYAYNNLGLRPTATTGFGKPSHPGGSQRDVWAFVTQGSLPIGRFHVIYTFRGLFLA